MARIGDLDAQAELAAQPKLPPDAAYLWGYFQELHATRGSNGFGLNPISRADIRLWEEDECRRLDGWERATILRIDRAFLGAGMEEGRTGEAQP